MSGHARLTKKEQMTWSWSCSAKELRTNLSWSWSWSWKMSLCWNLHVLSLNLLAQRDFRLPYVCLRNMFRF